MSDEILPLPNESSPVRLAGYISILRIDHWFKNVFILPGVVFAISAQPELLRPQMLLALAVGLLATCLAASSNYALNEILDARRDRLHPEKRHRAIAAGRVSIPVAWGMVILLGAAAVALGLAVNVPLGCAIAALLVSAWLYNVPPIRLKDLPYLDVVCESVNNPIRLAIGWFAVGCMLEPPCSLLLAYWALGAYLMAVKRFAEYRHIGRARQAAAYRTSFKYYDESRLLISIMFYATACAMFGGVFLARYHLELVLTAPFFAGFMAMYLRLGLKVDSAAQYPERLLRSRSVMVASLVLAAVVCFSLWFESPRLRRIFNPSIKPMSIFAHPANGPAASEAARDAMP